MTEVNAKVSTAKFRMLSPDGVAVEYFVFATTTPEEIDNLIEQSVYAKDQLLAAGFIVPNVGAVNAAIADAGVSALKEEFGVSDKNDIFHCVSMDIEPVRDGKSKVSFFGNGFKQPRDQWAITSLMLDPIDLQKALAPYYEFKLETFDKFGTFDVDFFVETYKSTNLNTRGNPYTNVSRDGIKVRDGAAPPAIGEAPEKPAEPDAPQEPDDIPF
jgi:hypothetical protein